MIQDTLDQIRGRIENSTSVSKERRRELLGLLQTLESEIGALSKTHEEQARSIAGFADLSTHEATRSSRNPELLKLSLEGLSSSVTEFEKSHPNLVTLVNDISRTLANLGI